MMIEGMNQRQVEILDLLWSVDDPSQVFDQLDNAELQEANVLLELILLAQWDHVMTVSSEVAQQIEDCRYLT